VALPPGSPRAVVRLVQAGRSVETATDGAYLFRNVAPGDDTLAVSIDGLEATRSVTVPAGPALIQDVDLAPAPR
jgi:hypothetical protein